MTPGASALLPHAPELRETPAGLRGQSDDRTCSSVCTLSHSQSIYAFPHRSNHRSPLLRNANKATTMATGGTSRSTQPVQALSFESSDQYQSGTGAEEVVVLESTLWDPPGLPLDASLSGVIYVQVEPNQEDSTDGDCVAIDVETACQLQESHACSSGKAAEDPVTAEHFPSGELGEQLPSSPVQVVSDEETCGGDFEHSYGKRQAEHSYSERPDTKSKAKEYPCSTCSFVTRHPSRLARHVLLHTGEKPHKCEVCGKGFRLRATMVMHLRTHTGEQPYTCKTCGRTFAYSSSLKKHEDTHTAERTYRCDVCDLWLKPRSLQRHMRTHTGERPYPCNVCTAVFADRQGFKRHMLRKHSSNE